MDIINPCGLPMIEFKHLKEKKCTYTQHFQQSFGYSKKLLKLSACAFLHAVWPDVLVTTVSEEVCLLCKKIKQ